MPNTQLGLSAAPTAAQRSHADRSLSVFPAGSNGEFDLPERLATVIESGSGCRLRCADGREMLDFSMGWGSVLVGHARAEIIEAVRERVVGGSNFSYTNVESLWLAEEIVRLSPACDRVRFCASGTEATMYCIRLARAFTGRDLILRFEGAYHGSNDEGVTSLFPSGAAPFPSPEPSSAGIGSEHTLVAPYNDSRTTGEIIARDGDDIAGVIVEPFQRCLSPRAGFLERLRGDCSTRGIPLIFDEVVTGFRLAYGGAQEKYGVTPDLVAYGKALGGGLPIGAFGGRAEIMDIVREDRVGRSDYVWTASTLGGNPVSCAAASAALEVYRREDTYPRLESLGERFRAGLRRALIDTGNEGQVIGEGPLGQIVFSSEPVVDYRGTRAGDRAKGRAMMLGLFESGVFLNPMGTKLYLSLAHDEDACDEFVTRLTGVLTRL